MSLKIIGAGFGRTGTLSTQHALNQLGFPCYHMVEVMNKTNKNHLDFWVKVADQPQAIQHDWPKVFDKYQATIDFPSSCVWKELVEAYPEAKVILTLHPKGPEGWYKSSIETIYSIEKMWESKLFAFFIPRARKMINMTSNLIWKRFLKGTMDNKAQAMERYLEHIEDVKRKVPADKLLVFSVDQGWDPLCEFLGLEIPGSDFPRVNDKAEMKKKLGLLSGVARLLVALLIVIVFTIVWTFLPLGQY